MLETFHYQNTPNEAWNSAHIVSNYYNADIRELNEAGFYNLPISGDALSLLQHERPDINKNHDQLLRVGAVA